MEYIQQCIEAGAYYWLRASGPEENLASALNRTRYQNIMRDLAAMGIPAPTPQEIYDYARSKWPPHKLHPAPNATRKEGR